MKYIVKKPFGNVKVGWELDKKDFSTFVDCDSYVLNPAIIALMLNAGFLEESDGKWRPKYTETFYYISTDTDTGLIVYEGVGNYDTDKDNCFQTRALAEAKLAEIKEVLRK